MRNNKILRDFLQKLTRIQLGFLFFHKKSQNSKLMVKDKKVNTAVTYFTIYRSKNLLVQKFEYLHH
jgi:hypothetical protein